MIAVIFPILVLLNDPLNGYFCSDVAFNFRKVIGFLEII